ncbi:gp16 [Streptomyces phage phiSASD1]|uniref:Gp16 n=1 Tax=Streptomyces phage phiSASD1 TaxID=747763 RepID=D7NW85_9CAUD|nr:gp16 [Streptomyces phage phiSASD1]ADE43483.1 gp16 [Streptomyces phage phiSASD1]
MTALRARLTPDGTTNTASGGRPVRLLSGLLTCDSCDGTLIVHHRPAVRRKTDTDESFAARPPLVGYRCPTRTDGGVCATTVSVSALPIEEYVTGIYLSTVGHMPMYRERTVVSGLEELAAVEDEIKEALSDMATNADAETFARLQKLQARSRELAEMDTDTRTELVPTGQTMAEFWEGAMVDDRRDLLADAFEDLRILPGRRGPKGFDPDRLIRRWAEEPDAGEDDEESLLEAVAKVRRMEANGVDVESWLAPM